MADSSLAANYRAKAQSLAIELLARARELEVQLRDAIEPFDVEERTTYAELYHQLERSNSHFPVGKYTDFHTQDWSVAGAFLSAEPGNAPYLDAFRELSEDEKEALQTRWQDPVVEACSRLFPDAKQLFIDVAGRLVVLRRLSGFRETLEQLADAVKPPWAKPIKAPQMPAVMMPAWAWRSNMPLRRPYYQRLDAIRKANLSTLRLIYDKTRIVRAIIEAVLDEIPVSALLAEPLPMPNALVLVDKLIATTIGDNAQIEGSAIGPEASIDG